MDKLNLPSYAYKISESDNKTYIFDPIRKKNLVLTPEEWVRQHFAHYFIKVKKYAPSALILEKKLEVNGTLKRIDLLITEKASPKILIELKAPHITLSQETFEQIARYNSVIGAEKIILSNGNQHIFAKFENEKYIFEPINL